ncbi:MAG: sigma-70 family RNA polymerase sigma factor, partial [Gemmatimonadaceae bacterium]|nr:sigma-70 family RNA polymerase sigma factor [Gemmatimonadaceae bacterium]
FFELWRTRADWRVSGSVPAYLYAAVRNRALSIRRRDAVEARWTEEEGREELRALSPSQGADTLLEDAERQAQLEAAINRLPPRCALIMQMRWHGGLSYSEIASTLGISTKGVENQLSRGLKALRLELAGD